MSQEYSLEYGTAVIEMHKTSIKPGQKVLIVDDLIATGGTTQAMISLVERLGGEVAGVLVLIELAGLKGREAIAGYRLIPQLYMKANNITVYSWLLVHSFLCEHGICPQKP